MRYYAAMVPFVLAASCTYITEVTQATGGHGGGSDTSSSYSSAHASGAATSSSGGPSDAAVDVGQPCDPRPDADWLPDQADAWVPPCGFAAPAGCAVWLEPAWVGSGAPCGIDQGFVPVLCPQSTSPIPQWCQFAGLIGTSGQPGTMALLCCKP